MNNEYNEMSQFHTRNITIPMQLTEWLRSQAIASSAKKLSILVYFVSFSMTCHLPEYGLRKVGQWVND